MKTPAFTITNDTVTVVWNGKSHTFKKGAPNFAALRQAIIDSRWDDVERNLTVAGSVRAWAQGKFSIDGEKILFEGKEMPGDISGRIMQMSAEGQDPQILLNFWERLQKNPSMRSVTQLFSFLNNVGIPLTKDGTFLAYKSVREDYLDHHSGTFTNSPGAVLEMPRNQISDDPNHACHEGFHVGALEYANSFGSHDRRIMICEIDPANVVCVPYDESCRKMRVCSYKVVGEHAGGYMSSTVEHDDAFDYSDVDSDQDYDEENDPLNDEYDMEGSEDSYVEPEPVKAAKKPKKVSFAKFDAMNTKELLDVSLADLRQYAAKGLKIVGASKIPGGKVALVSTIVKTRRKKS